MTIATAIVVAASILGAALVFASLIFAVATTESQPARGTGSAPLPIDRRRSIR